MELNSYWNFWRGGGANPKKPFCGVGAMDIFWNHTDITVIL